jgi:hypothetical protein
MNIFVIVIAIAITGTLLPSRIASATELPSYEATGFPITPHQISVLGSAKVKEQSPSTYENLAKPAESRLDSKQLR